MSGPVTIEIQIAEAFEFLRFPARYKAVWGGRAGGKSHSIAAQLLIDSIEKQKRVLCCREVQNSIKDSVKRLLDDKIKAYGFGSFYKSTDAEIRGANGSLFVFAGLRTLNAESIKSMEAIDVAWVEEAHTVSQASLMVLTPTIRKPGSELWFSWNPRHKTDAVDVMFRGGVPPPNSVVKEIQWRDNPWFSDESRLEMEWTRQRDPDRYRHVWAGGYLERSDATVFTNWRIGSEDEFTPNEKTRFYLGADWGFSVDPSVLIRVYFEGRALFIDREAYAVGCDIDYTPFLFGGTADEELQRLNAQAWASPGMARWKNCEGIPHARLWPIRADSARPETISYMQRHGFTRIEAARKGPGSVEEGVEFLKSYDIVVHPDCRHCIDELSSYSYKVEKDAMLDEHGKLVDRVLPALEDKKNHTIDSIRYSVEGLMGQGAPLSSGSIHSTARKGEFRPMTSVRRVQF